MTGLDGALRGLRVLDASRVLAGPACGQILADLGAEVLKIEEPQRGDETRSWGPPFGVDGLSAYFLSCNRGKRSAAIDLKSPPGRRVFLELVKKADIVLENFRPGAASKLGLSSQDLLAVNPRVILCSVSGYGRSGRFADDAGYDFVVQGLSGMMAMTGPKDGMPAKVGVAIVDVVTSLYATVGTLAALHARQSSGHGYVVDVALFDCAVASMVNLAQAYLSTGKVPDRQGNAHLQIVPYELFATADGWLVLAIGNDGQFKRFCDVIDRNDLACDARFATNQGRVAAREILVAEIRKMLAARPTEEWIKALRVAAVPAGPVWNFDQLFASPLATDRGIKVTVRKPDGTPVDLVRSPLVNDLSGALAPPNLGEHTEQALAEWLGYDAGTIARLKREGAW